MMEGRQVATDVACTVCGCVCDDLNVAIEHGHVVQFSPPCPLAQPWFDGLSRPIPDVARVRGRAVELNVALDAAAEILAQCRAPLIFGLSRSSTEGQRAATRLAEHLGGTIDTTASVCHGPSIMAIQQVGESTSSLGEVRHRSDLVIIWGADPVESHPRHFERYSLHPTGQWTPRGRQDRQLVVIDHQPTATSAQADHFVQVPANHDFELIWALRQRLRGIPLPDDFQIGISHADIDSLVDKFKHCRYGVVFFGLGLAQTGLGHANVTGLLQLVAELNRYTRFTARRLRIPGDVTGADSVLCWQTGYAFAVNLARGYPRYNPGEYTANELLIRGEVDGCLLVGSESVDKLSAPAIAALRELPTIALDYPNVTPGIAATVQFTTAIYGIHRPGTAYRMDEVPIPLRAIIPSSLPSDGEILSTLQARLIRSP